MQRNNRFTNIIIKQLFRTKSICPIDLAALCVKIIHFFCHILKHTFTEIFCMTRFPVLFLAASIADRVLYFKNAFGLPGDLLDNYNQMCHKIFHVRGALVQVLTMTLFNSPYFENILMRSFLVHESGNGPTKSVRVRTASRLFSARNLLI